MQKRSNHKQSARWQHVSQLKASALSIRKNKLWWFRTQQLILWTGTAIWLVTEPHFSISPDTDSFLLCMVSINLEMFLLHSITFFWLHSEMYVPLLVLLKSTLIYYDILQFGSIKFFIEFTLDGSISFPCPGVTPTEWASKICL